MARLSSPLQGEAPRGATVSACLRRGRALPAQSAGCRLDHAGCASHLRARARRGGGHAQQHRAPARGQRHRPLGDLDAAARGPGGGVARRRCGGDRARGCQKLAAVARLGAAAARAFGAHRPRSRPGLDVSRQYRRLAGGRDGRAAPAGAVGHSPGRGSIGGRPLADPRLHLGRRRARPSALAHRLQLGARRRAARALGLPVGQARRHPQWHRHANLCPAGGRACPSTRDAGPATRRGGDRPGGAQRAP